MGCYFPSRFVLDFESGLTDNNKYIYKPAGRWDPSFMDDEFSIKVPCGHCLGCRLDSARHWADRMILELDSYNGLGVFLTLTYNDDHLRWSSDDDSIDIPREPTLYKRDVVLFMKRLRKHYSDRVLRFFMCGEYGSRTGRPHYHIILYGLGLEDFPDKFCIGKNEFGQPHFGCNSLAQIWSCGFVCLAAVTYKSCSYVARYCMKKAFEPREIDLRSCRLPEYVNMSRNPGIGAIYLLEHPDCLKLSKIYLKDDNGSVEVYLPKYFIDKIDDDERSAIIEERRKLASDREFLKMSQTSLSYHEYLKLEQLSEVNRTKILFNKREVI